MARTTVLGRLNWRAGQVREIRHESATARTMALDVPSWPGHLPGQHVDVRLTADDGYSTQRSYSIASAPDGTRVELTVERLANGEVSPYLTDVLQPGDPLELRGPIGGWFVWRPEGQAPALRVDLVYTRGAPEGWGGPVGRLDASKLATLGWPPSDRPACFVCGPTGFVEAVADLLVDQGHDPQRIKTERFGPTGT